ncbi:hypothetical protein XBI1_2800032 [Xenorhabdus bovienii str. Intermedium]|uniref:Uncharacterized protein n=1 Tax=Xenorhabdus bovienii str. Intermedium TaxID=1379677 RepID=A0A077QNR5_XENBV|nr:hypothetical protein XBI1_2800032 [Xenorhabdus bovienii str. Intermedium]
MHSMRICSNLSASINLLILFNFVDSPESKLTYKTFVGANKKAP